MTLVQTGKEQVCSVCETHISAAPLWTSALGCSAHKLEAFLKRENVRNISADLDFGNYHL